METILLYDETFEGLLTAVFEAYARKLPDALILPRHGSQAMLGAEEVPVVTNAAKADRVLRGLVREAGSAAHEFIYTAFLTPHEDRATLIYRFMRLCFTMGAQAIEHFANPTVMTLTKYNRQVGWEIQHLLGFVRLRCLGGDLYYGAITPDNDVLTILAPHFADRFGDQRIALHDVRRGKLALCAYGAWELREAPDITPPEETQDEAELVALWRKYFFSIDNPQRRNLVLQRQHMPRRYWKYMTEVSGASPAPESSLRSDDSAVLRPLPGHQAPKNTDITPLI